MYEEARAMSHSTLAAVIIPVVVITALAVWLGLVFRAQRHPGKSKADPLKSEVSGGVFESKDGRQVMPHRDATPTKPSSTRTRTATAPVLNGVDAAQAIAGLTALTTLD
jgi:cytoskeletal protein RodZ